MKNKLFKYVSFSVAIFLLGLIVACSGGNSDSKGSAKKEITLKVLDWNTINPDIVQAEMKKVVKKSLPYVNLEFENINWADFKTLLQTKIAANRLPDIMLVKASDIPLYAKAGHLMELSSSEFMEQFPDDLRDSFKIDGKEYALPYTSNVQGVFYNKKIFQEHNIEVPKTWAELMKVAEALKSKGITPFGGYWKDTQIGNNTMQFAMLEVFSKNPQWGIDLQNGKVSFATSSEYKTVFEHMKDLYPLTSKDPFGIDSITAAEIFANEETAIFITGTFMSGRIEKNNPDFKYGFFPTPAVNAKNTKVLIQSDHSWSGSATTEYPEEVKKVLEILATDKETAKFYIETIQAFSQIPDVVSDSTQPYISDIAKYRKEDGIVDVNIGNIQIPWAYQVEYSKYISEWLFEQKTLEEALKAADDFKSNVKF